MIKTKKSKKADLERKRSTFFLIGLVCALSFVLYAFEWKTNVTKSVDDMGTNKFFIEDDVIIPPTFEKKEVVKQTVKVPKIVIVDNTTETPLDFAFFEDDPTDFEPINYPDLTTIPEEAVDENLDKVISYAEVMPEFPGGYKALLSYLSKNVKYPAIAQQNGIKGKVYVKFVVDEKGRIYNATIARGVDQALNKEALRVINSMPLWKPGMQGGKTVKVSYTVPINFVLQ